MDRTQPLISVDHISHTYISSQRHAALRDISFSVFPTNTTAIIGPSGCGKSTLLRILAGLTQPTSGSIIYSDSSGLPCMIFQQPAAFPWLTVYENIRFGCRRMHTENQHAYSMQLIKEVGLVGHERKYMRELSGGQQQCVALAMVLAHQPSVLLMDEPFSSLDAQTREQMQEVLLSVSCERQCTIVFVTHDIEEAVFIADDVIVMNTHPGTIREQIHINLPRPRDFRTRAGPQFLLYKEKIRSLL